MANVATGECWTRRAFGAVFALTAAIYIEVPRLRRLRERRAALKGLAGNRPRVRGPRARAPYAIDALHNKRRETARPELCCARKRAEVRW